jgi:predicted CoA-binding protein
MAGPVNHDTYSNDYIRDILQSVKAIAIVGASPNEVRPSYFVARYLVAKGYRVFPINPGQAGRSLLGATVYARLGDVPDPIDMVDIFRSSDAAAAVVDEALALDPLPKVIWMQLGVRNDEAAARAERAGLKVVMNRCPKIEFGRLSGEIGWAGVNSRLISSRKPILSGGTQSWGLTPKNGESRR